ncbi:MAG: hypothetical protein AB6733_18590 [Clostridiaceae bacterium]
MSTQTYNRWTEPEIKHKGVHVQMERRPLKKRRWHLREGSILYYVKYTLMAAFTVMLFWFWYVIIWALMG